MLKENEVTLHELERSVKDAMDKLEVFRSLLWDYRSRTGKFNPGHIDQVAGMLHGLSKLRQAIEAGQNLDTLCTLDSLDPEPYDEELKLRPVPAVKVYKERTGCSLATAVARLRFYGVLE